MIKTSKHILCISLWLVFILILHSCYKEGTPEANPFEENVKPHDTIGFTISNLDPNSIAGIYTNVFGPTCANSGCHDGTFEPDFRTMESSYHSLVYKVPVKNDGTLSFRVDPGNPDRSALLKRLTGAITPQMPIEVEPDSDWFEKEQSYIQNIRNWIENGAKDLSGNDPRINMIKPSLLGAVARYNNYSVLRDDGYGPFLIPDTAEVVSIYLSFDPINIPENFTLNEFVLGYERTGFVPQDTFTMEVLDTPLIDYGLFGKLVSYTHKIDLIFNSISFEEDHMFFRARIQDESNMTTEIPTNDAFYNIKEYMSFIRTD